MDVTYYVVPPFVPSDDGIVPSDDGVAPGEAVECPSANAAVVRAEALSRKPGCAGALAVPAIRRVRGRQGHPQVRRRSG